MGKRYYYQREIDRLASDDVESLREGLEFRLTPIGKGRILNGPKEHGRACPRCQCQWFVRYEEGQTDTVDECLACLAAFLVKMKGA